MAPKFFRTSSFNEPDNKNPSILVQEVSPDNFDLIDCWGGRGSSSISRYRVSYPEKKVPSGLSWGSRFTTLSSNVLSAGAAVTARAKQLRVCESTRWAINRLRSSTVETLPRTASVPAKHLFNEPNLDDYYDSDDQPEEEDDTCSETDNKRPKLQYSWIQYR